MLSAAVTAVQTVATPSAILDAAKFTPPSLAGVVARPQLQAQVESIAAPARWVCAPSGAGKSTLAAALAAGSGLPVI